MALWKASLLVLAYLSVSLAFSTPRAFKRRPALVVYSEKANPIAEETSNEGPPVNPDDTKDVKKEPPPPVIRKLGDNVGPTSQTDPRRVSIVGPSLMSFGGQPERKTASRWGPTYSGSVSNVGSVSVSPARSKTAPKQAPAAAATTSASRQSASVASAFNPAAFPYVTPVSVKQTGSTMAPPSPGAVPVPSVSAPAAAGSLSDDSGGTKASTTKDAATKDALAGSEKSEVEESTQGKKQPSAAVGIAESTSDESKGTTLPKDDSPKEALAGPEKTEASASEQTEPSGPAKNAPPIPEETESPPRPKYIKGFDDFFATPGSGSFLENSRAATDVWPTKDSSSAARSNLIRSGPDSMDPRTSDWFTGKVKTTAVELESDSPAIFVPPKGTSSAPKAPTPLPTKRASLSAMNVSAKTSSKSRPAQASGSSKAIAPAAGSLSAAPKVSPTTDTAAGQPRAPLSAVKASAKTASPPSSEMAEKAPETRKAVGPSSSFDAKRLSPAPVSPSSRPASDTPASSKASSSFFSMERAPLPDASEVSDWTADAPAPSGRIPVGPKVTQSAQAQNDEDLFFAKPSKSEKIMSDEDAIPAKYRVFSKDYMETLKAHAESNEEEGDDWTERYLRLKKGRKGAGDGPTTSMSAAAMAEADLFPEVSDFQLNLGRVFMLLLTGGLVTEIFTSLSLPEQLGEGIRVVLTVLLEPIEKFAKFLEDLSPGVTDTVNVDTSDGISELEQSIQTQPPSIPAETGPDMSETTGSLPEMIKKATQTPLPPSIPAETGLDDSGTTRSLPEAIEELTKPPSVAIPDVSGPELMDQAKESASAPAVETVPEAVQPSNPLSSETVQDVPEPSTP